MAEANRKKVDVLTTAIAMLGEILRQSFPHTSGAVDQVKCCVNNGMDEISNDFTQKVIRGEGPAAYTRWMRNSNEPVSAPSDIPLPIYSEREINPAYKIVQELKSCFTNQFDFLKVKVDIPKLPYFGDSTDLSSLKSGLYRSKKDYYGSPEKLCAIIKTSDPIKDANRCVLVRDLSTYHTSDSVEYDFVYVPIEKAWVKYSANTFIKASRIQDEVDKILNDYGIGPAKDALDEKQLMAFISLWIGNLRAIFKDSFESQFELRDDVHVGIRPETYGIHLYKSKHEVPIHVLIWRYRHWTIGCKLSTPESEISHLTVREFYNWKENLYTGRKFDEFDRYTRDGLAKQIQLDIQEKFSMFDCEKAIQST